MLGHMFNIINGNAPTYLTSGIIMNQHRYSTRARELSCVIPRVKSSGLTSFGDCSLVRRFCSPKVRKSEIKGSSFRRFCSPKVRKSDDDFYSFLL